MSRQSDAMRDYFDSIGMSQVEVAKKMGILQGTVSGLLSGRDGIGKNRAAKLARVFGFDRQFLLTGEGSLFPPKIRTGAVANESGSSAYYEKSSQGSGEDAQIQELKDRVADLNRQLEEANARVDKLLSILANYSQ